MARGIELLYLASTVFRFIPGLIDRVYEGTQRGVTAILIYMPVHDVQDKGLRHPLRVRLVTCDEHRAYY
jgi:hypothetical protein